MRLGVGCGPAGHLVHASDATPTAMAVGTLILRGAMVGRAVSMCARYVGGEVEGRAEM